MSRLLVAFTAVGVVCVALSLQAMVMLLRRHTVDARRAGPLVERRRRMRSGTVPPRLDTLEVMTSETLGGTALIARQMWAHLADLGEHAREPVDIAPPAGARERAEWMDDQLTRLESAYRES